MAKLSAADRKAIPRSKFGLPEKAGSAKGKAASGSYPMPDKKHAAVAKAYARRFASPAERARINAKANRILGSSAGKGKR
jgi:hypothetical protein